MGCLLYCADSNSFHLSRTFIFLLMMCYSVCNTISGRHNNQNSHNTFNRPKPFRSKHFYSTKNEVTYGFEIPRHPGSPNLSQQRFNFLFSTPDAIRNKINPYHFKLTSINHRRRNSWLGIILLLSGDLHQNPGPTRSRKPTPKIVADPEWPCGICNLDCVKKAIQCDDCEVWYHTKCMVISDKEYKKLGKINVSWHCLYCGLPNFSSGLFNNDLEKAFCSNRFSILSTSSSSNDNPTFDQVSPSKSPTHQLPISNNHSFSLNDTPPFDHGSPSKSPTRQLFSTPIQQPISSPPPQALSSHTPTNSPPKCKKNTYQIS